MTCFLSFEQRVDLPEELDGQENFLGKGGEVWLGLRGCVVYSCVLSIFRFLPASFRQFFVSTSDHGPYHRLRLEPVP